MSEIPELKEVKRGLDLNLEQYEGMRIKIETMQVVDSTSNWDKGKQLPKGTTIPVKKLKVITEKVTSAEKKDGTKFDIFASELFNLSKEENGEWVIPTNESSDISKFMKRQKVEHYKELVGTSVMVKLNG